MSSSPEQHFTTETLPQNLAPVDPLFGRFFSLMKSSLCAGGSEFGLGMTLFSLAVSIRATNIVEIGRFKGFSTLCLASALKFLDDGWQEPAQHKQRPDVDYTALESPKRRQLISIDPFPTPEAVALIGTAGLGSYVEFVDHRYDQVNLDGQADLFFIDGEHTYEACHDDVRRAIPRNLRPGGYFVLHDYYGWYDAEGRNRSPIKRVIDDLVATGVFQHLLIDTGYMSFCVFRLPDPARPF
jgi:hypothetical protein